MEAEVRLQEVGSEWTEDTGKTAFWKKKKSMTEEIEKEQHLRGESSTGTVEYLFNVKEFV